MTSISQLKENQERHDANEKALQKAARPFLDAFQTKLKNFTQDAVDNHIRGVRPFKDLATDSRHFDATVTLNDFDLIIVSDFKLLPFDLEADETSRIFVYRANHPESPLIDILIVRFTAGTFHWIIRTLIEGEPNELEPMRPLSPDGGEHAALLLIDTMYKFTAVWNVRPNLEDLKVGKYTRPIGFRA
jgi:hypothetical protein